MPVLRYERRGQKEKNMNDIAVKALNLLIYFKLAEYLLIGVVFILLTGLLILFSVAEYLDAKDEEARILAKLDKETKELLNVQNRLQTKIHE
jgi:hypothetical protein